MNVWIEPVVDRSEEDIVNRTEKGYLKYSDLNRIEGNSAFIGSLISLPLDEKDWSGRPLIKKENLQAIIDNLIQLTERWPVANLPDIPVHPLNDYIKINKIEKIQLMLKNNIDATHEAQIRCGECFAGEIGVI